MLFRAQLLIKTFYTFITVKVSLDSHLGIEVVIIYDKKVTVINVLKFA